MLAYIAQMVRHQIEENSGIKKRNEGRGGVMVVAALVPGTFVIAINAHKELEYAVPDITRWARIAMSS
jgi:hypothetical protein